MILLVLTAMCGTFAEEMPVVTDQPYTEAELAQMAEEKARQLVDAQQLLIDLGYMTSVADGIAGPRTAAALKAFQEDSNLPVTGELDEETLAALKRMEETVSTAKELQQRMIDLGYLRGTADGIFGERSRAALRLFQALNGLEATGEADEATRERLFSDDAQALPARLTGGDKGERVQALQERLIQLGFLGGRADGSYGQKTINAVTWFQKHLIAQGIDDSLGISATGEATPATQALLFDPGYSSYIKDLSLDEEGDEALRVERRLVSLGYMDSTADDHFDAYALQAMKAFAEQAGIEADVVGKDLIDALFSDDAPVAVAFVPHDIAAGDTGLAVRAVQEALVQCGMVIAVPDGKYGDGTQQAITQLCEYLTCRGSAEAALFADPAALSVEAQQALEQGLLGYVKDVRQAEDGAELTEDPEARRVQRRLHTLYYLSKYGIDGKFGESSVEALRLFQQTNGLEASGVADEATQARLFSAEAVCKQLPYRVEVDIDRQRVYVFEKNDDGLYEQIKTFVCSTGLGNSTPRGIFLDGFPANYWHHFEKFDCWAKYSFEIEGNIMFHSVLFDEKDTGTLREGSLYALGQKASHGCIRLKVSDARWLFENCKRGTLVILIY